jgi:hypothetical protein
MDLRRENRVLRIAVGILFALLLTGVATGDGQSQRLPGPGTGVVDVSVVNDARVNAAQHGDWRVAQQGDWRVGVQGTVATLPAMPPSLRSGKYVVRWPGQTETEELTVHELHPSGWARTGRRWVNLATAVSLEEK